jgi:hypothetical protein
MQQSSDEIASVLRHLAENLERGDSTIVQLADEQIFIPANSDVSCKYETVGGIKALNIRVTWDILASPPQLIHQHSDRIQDSLGNLYEVFIYGAPRLDGTWTGWLEFVPVNRALASLRTDRETTQPDLTSLEYWSTGLEPVYLAGAFERAKSV